MHSEMRLIEMVTCSYSGLDSICKLHYYPAKTEQRSAMWDKFRGGNMLEYASLGVTVFIATNRATNRSSVA